MGESHGADGRRIVVGVDGSVPSKAALAWAVRQAALTGAVVEAVIAWEYPDTYGLGPALGVDMEGIAATVVSDAITGVAGPGGPVKICPRVVEGHPARVLIEASAGADLLVVGSRGHGGFAGAVLGSVSQHCIQHATCPVVVVRGTGTGARP
ncbi:MAG TPA: universal stress protein [Streptosporangiaceae bacterium]|nr:universal stress protein [Streptosporangiaceae bacterium]